MNRPILIKKILREMPLEQRVVVAGWVRSMRQAKTVSFLILNDGSCQENLQIILNDKESLGIGTSVRVEGILKKSQGKGQAVELVAEKIKVVGAVDEDYPLQKKAVSLEFLRDNAHLRSRTNLFGAIFRIRHSLAMATHQFFDQRGFYYLNSPIITGVDAEGAGEMFKLSDDDYFSTPVSLCVSGQLEAECFALGLNAVYTFGPTFRAENSNTPRHLAEFWMVEPEVAFVDLDDLGELAIDYLKYLINFTLKNCSKEMEAITSYHRFCAKQEGMAYRDHTLELEKIIASKAKNTPTISYEDAIKLCSESKKKFEFGTTWGIELQREHERFLAEEVFNSPVIVRDYPREGKAFYMKQNDDDTTVAAMDVLVPGMGEIVGGSMREDDLAKLEERMEQMNVPRQPLDWYLALRRFGSVPHGGFGLGFERAMAYITGMKNVRDVIPFPRTPNNCRF